jgi:sulfatase maturation enzyme AslB (radical SAM superfamily)
MDQRDTIPEAKMLEIADDMVAMGVQAVTFSGGGEPLIYKPLPRVIERLAAGGVRIASLTNGSNLKRTMADAFAAHGTWIRVSLDGWDEASYTRARRVPDGTFTHLLENMRAFAARGSRCTLGAAYIINQANHGHIYDICARLKEVGANHVKLSGVIVGNEPEENNRYHAGIKAEVGRQIERARTLEDDSFSVIDAFHDLEARIWHKPYHTCPFLMFQPVIGADCVVYTCHDKAYNQAGVLGSIRERSFRDFWFSEENGARFYGLDPSVTCRHHCTVHARNLAILEYLSLDPEHQAFV